MGTQSLAEMRATEPRERLEAFVRDVVATLPLSRQRTNALVYARGLIEHGGRKSLQPTLFRLGADGAQYESLQQFLADSPWDPAAVWRACAERVVPRIAPLAWVIDDTGFPKDGRHSPGVMRQYSGTLGKVSNCQIGVSLHAVGLQGTLPLGFALYLPEEWTQDPERRRRAKIPAPVAFHTKPELACDLIERAAEWHIPTAPVLADQAYGDSAELRARLHAAGVEYVVAISERTGLFGPDTVFGVRARRPGRGRPPSVAHPDRPHTSALALARGLPAEAFQKIAFSTGPGGHELAGRFALVRVVAAHPIERLHLPPRQEWLIVEWPEGDERPSDLWLSNLPADTPPERLVQLARLRWVVELDYRQLKGELGLDHYEGRSYLGWHHHCALVTLAHAFLTEERLCPRARRPA
jgi:SRSO17 transposase